MTHSILDTWDSLATPANEGDKRAKQVPGTNCWVSKSHDGSLGLIITETDPPNRKINFENLTIRHVGIKTLVLGGKELEVYNCLEAELDPDCEAGILATVLDRMSTYEPSGKYGTATLMEVLDQVIRLFKMAKRPPKKEEIVGAWGELAILEMALKTSPSAIESQRRVTCWESFEGRTVVDFSFPHIDGGVAIEVKTSRSGREHHIGSLSQLAKPEDYQEGWLASLEVREVDHLSGDTVTDLTTRIIQRFEGSEGEVSNLTRAFHNRLEMRGAACFDDSLNLILPEGGLRMIRMADVPKPGLQPEILDVEWTVDLSEIEFIDSIPLLES